MEAEFRQWQAARDGAAVPSVEFLHLEDEAAVLSFGSSVAAISLMPVEGASFFAEATEEAPAEVEEWLSDANSYFAERVGLTFAAALEHLASTAPASVRGASQSCRKRPCPHAASAGTGEAPAEMEEEDDVQFDNGDDITSVEIAEDRSAQRAAYTEDRRWDTMVDSSSQRGSRQASQVLMREMRALLQLQGEGSTKALEIEMVQDNLYHWKVVMHAAGFPATCSLRTDLEGYALRHPGRVSAVEMDVTFPDSYPMEPPFIRIVRPRFQMHTGHITIGGSVCMELLTPSGWLPSVSLENVFISIRSEMIEGGGRLDPNNAANEYSAAEAREAFTRVARRYGWLK
eukprot:TRINITY_DN38771_c0_g1_i1.p1 TRINITY_DN38771_c0_g1~~TRINITY_DN38771_c0_g1_i1.p1  ORF type:complete len:344 (-),score=69.37 TRINITY_DN38771_c0_g1_i1:140-1171(-)